jgi:hypothetical protein
MPQSSPPERKSVRAGEDPFDRLALAQLARAGDDLTKPTDVVNFIYFPSEVAARSAAAALEPEGYRVNVQRAVMGTKWLTQARVDVVLSPENVASQRARFEDLAMTYGGEYSGWEVAVTK